MRKILMPLIVAAALTMTSSVAADKTPAPLTEKQAKLADRYLKGKVAGKPISCIGYRPDGSTIGISDDILLYRISSSLVYQNQLRTSCYGLADDRNILIIRSFGNGRCSGDFITLVDRYSGISSGSCTLGEFVPYHAPPKAG